MKSSDSGRPVRRWLGRRVRVNGSNKQKRVFRMQWIDECTGIPLGIHGFGYKYVCVCVYICMCIYIYISLVVWCIHCFSFDTWN